MLKQNNGYKKNYGEEVSLDFDILLYEPCRI